MNLETAITVELIFLFCCLCVGVPTLTTKLLEWLAVLKMNPLQAGGLAVVILMVIYMVVQRFAGGPKI